MFSMEQIVAVLKQADAGAPVEQMKKPCREAAGSIHAGFSSGSKSARHSMVNMKRRKLSEGFNSPK
jgi:hypothetical protein